MLSPLRTPQQVEAQERVRAWTRARFALPPAAPVTVAERAPRLPGFPPLQTVVEFWTLDGTRHHFSLFKPVVEVAADDLPFPWLKDSLALPDGAECNCC